MVKDKETLMLGAGAGIGVIQTVVFKEYLDPMYGNIPFIGDYLPAPWGRISVLGNILIGGVFLGITQFTNLIANKNYDINNFLKIYGITTLVGGIANGIFYGGASPMRARAAGTALRLARPIQARANNMNSMSPLTPTGVPAVRVLS